MDDLTTGIEVLTTAGDYGTVESVDRMHREVSVRLHDTGEVETWPADYVEPTGFATARERDAAVTLYYL